MLPQCVPKLHLRREINSLALAAAHVDEFVSKFTGKPPKAPLAGVRMAKHTMWFNPAKAVAELGMPQTPPTEALADAIRWFRDNGYVRRLRPGAGHA